MPLGADTQTHTQAHIPMCEQKQFQETRRAWACSLCAPGLKIYGQILMVYWRSVISINIPTIHILHYMVAVRIVKLNFISIFLTPAYSEILVVIIFVIKTEIAF